MTARRVLFFEETAYLDPLIILQNIKRKVNRENTDEGGSDKSVKNHLLEVLWDDQCKTEFKDD